MKMAERGGFEPPNGKNPLTVFETAAFDRSAISPVYKKSAPPVTRMRLKLPSPCHAEWRRMVSAWDSSAA